MMITTVYSVTDKRKYFIHKSFYCQCLFVLFGSFALFAYESTIFYSLYSTKIKDYRNVIIPGSPKVSIAFTDNVKNTGVTGSLFVDNKVYTYNGERYFSLDSWLEGAEVTAKNSPRREFTTSYEAYSGKYKYGIVTTIHNVSQAIRSFISKQLPNEWRLIIVHDTLTPSTFIRDLEVELSKNVSSQIINLDREQQYILGQQFPRFMNLIPWNHFGRKNIGYLYALLHNARMIFDFDDDNVLSGPLDDESLEAPMNIIRRIHPVTGGNYDTFFTTECPVVNIFSLYSTTMVSNDDDTPPTPTTIIPIWPRGFPLPCLRSTLHRNSTPIGTNLKCTVLTNVSVTSSSVAWIQFLSNIEPDVDSIYRLTRPLPVSFVPTSLSSSSIRNNNRHLLYTVPSDSGIYTPYNAQSSLVLPHGLWTLLLPISVHGRVSDIWRSYIIQRLFQDTELVVGVSSAMIVNQYRNYHNTLADMKAEEDLYYKGLQLIHRLQKWKGKSNSLIGRYEELLIELYERDYIGIEDIYLGQEWLRILSLISFPFPVLTNDPSVDRKKNTYSSEPGTDEWLRLPLTDPREVGPRSVLPLPPSIMDDINPSVSSDSTVSASKEYPSVSFQVRTYGPRLKELWMTLIPSYLLFVPWKEWTTMDLTIVWDGESSTDHYAATLLSNLPPYPRTIFENIPPTGTLVEWGNRGIGYSRQQYSNFYMDRYTNADCIGIMDSDTQFIFPVTPEYLFRSDSSHEAVPLVRKPIQIGIGFNASAYPYQPWLIGVQLAIGRPKVIHRMLVSGFPVLVKREHFGFLRKHMIQTTRSSNFEEAFRKVSVGNADYDTLCQFDIMVNYLWYYHRNDYSWHIKDPSQNPVPYANLHSFQIDPEVQYYHDYPEFMVNKNGGHEQATFPFLADFLCLASNYTAGSCPTEYRKGSFSKEWETQILTNLRIDTWLPLYRWYEQGYLTNMSTFFRPVTVGTDDTPWTSTKESWQETWSRHQHYYIQYQNQSGAFRWRTYNATLHEPWHE